MDKINLYLNSLFLSNQVPVADKRKELFETFAADEKNRALVTTILENQKKMVTDWKIKNRIEDIRLQAFMIPNATVGKAYHTVIDFEKNNWTDFAYYQLDHLGAVGGMSYDKSTGTVAGIPENSGEYRLSLKYRLTDEPEDTELHEKIIPFVINPDPKSLWKNIPSDQADPYWKDDHCTAFAPIGKRHVVVASKRGRSHANVGSFRDDDFAFADISATGWSIVSLADGAGSASISRQGSRLACRYIVEYFQSQLTGEIRNTLETLILSNQANGNEAVKKELSLCIYNLIGGGAKKVHDRLHEFAIHNGYQLTDLNTTLIFTLFKTFDFGTVVLSFGVGDCPVAVIPADFSEVKLMNWLDVGEFGGGTRFITTTDIFSSPKFASRINFKVFPDFAYMFLMTDGIYDPKFVVEANLEKPEKWKEFVNDLKGANDAGNKVDLDANNTHIEQQLAEWMDFWSPGNHDDRTLAIIF